MQAHSLTAAGDEDAGLFDAEDSSEERQPTYTEVSDLREQAEEAAARGAAGTSAEVIVKIAKRTTRQTKRDGDS
jgi:hypothetical protein